MWTGRSGLVPRFLLLWFLFPKTSVSCKDTGRLNELSSASLRSLLCQHNKQLTVLEAYLVTSASVSGFSMTDLGLQANGQIYSWDSVCLPVSILAKEGGGDQQKSSWSDQSVEWTKSKPMSTVVWLIFNLLDKSTQFQRVGPLGHGHPGSGCLWG